MFLQGLAHQRSWTESKGFVELIKVRIYGGRAKVELIWIRRQLLMSFWKRFSLSSSPLVFFLSISLPFLPSIAQSTKMPQRVQSLWGWCDELTPDERRVKQEKQRAWLHGRDQAVPLLRGLSQQSCVVSDVSSIWWNIWTEQAFLPIYFYFSLIEGTVSMSFFWNRPWYIT